jgi:transposase
MMLKILVWGYANGIQASRKIAKRVHSDVTTEPINANQLTPALDGTENT